MRPLTALLLLTLCPRLVQAQPPLAQPATDRLIRQLGSDRYVEREAASQKLEELGWHTRATLLKVVADPDVERRARARRLLQAMEARFQGQVRAVADTARWLAEPVVAPLQRKINERQLARRLQLEDLKMQLILVEVRRMDAMPVQLKQANVREAALQQQLILLQVQRLDAKPVQLKVEQALPKKKPAK